LWPTIEDLAFRPSAGDSRIEADTHGLLVLRRPVRPSSFEVCNVAAQSPVEMAFHHRLKASSVEWTKDPEIQTFLKVMIAKPLSAQTRQQLMVPERIPKRRRGPDIHHAEKIRRATATA